LTSYFKINHLELFLIMKQEKYLVEPAYIYVPLQTTLLYAIIISGFVMTLRNKKLKLRGVSYYIRPIRESENHCSTPYFAAPR
jgi:hypothetical protein